VLITTGIKPLIGQHEQYATRLFFLEAPEDMKRIRAALAMQAQLELHPPTSSDPSFLAFQAYLQAQAPWDVIVPFADKLAKQMGEKDGIEGRIVRDFARLLSFIKAVAVMRHVRRVRDEQGRLVATLDDYRTVRELVNSIYEAAASKASIRIRETVEAVCTLVNTPPADKEG